LFALEPAAPFNHPSRCRPHVSIGAAEVPHQLGEPVDSEPDIDAVGDDVDPLNEKLDDPRLLGREQFIPERVEAVERLPDLSLSDLGIVLARRLPGADNDLGGLDESADLVDDRPLDLARGEPSLAKRSKTVSTRWDSISMISRCRAGRSRVPPE
jgi:hypothetical protein